MDWYTGTSLPNIGDRYPLCGALLQQAQDQSNPQCRTPCALLFEFASRTGCRVHTACDEVDAPPELHKRQVRHSRLFRVYLTFLKARGNDPGTTRFGTHVRKKLAKQLAALEHLENILAIPGAMELVTSWIMNRVPKERDARRRRDDLDVSQSSDVGAAPSMSYPHTDSNANMLSLNLMAPACTSAAPGVSTLSCTTRWVPSQAWSQSQPPACFLPARHANFLTAPEPSADLSQNYLGNLSQDARAHSFPTPPRMPSDRSPSSLGDHALQAYPSEGSSGADYPSAHLAGRGAFYAPPRPASRSPRPPAATLPAPAFPPHPLHRLNRDPPHLSVVPESAFVYGTHAGHRPDWTVSSAPMWTGADSGVANLSVGNNAVKAAPDADVTPGWLPGMGN